MNKAYTNTKLYTERIYTMLCRESHSVYCSCLKTITVLTYITKLYSYSVYCSITKNIYCPDLPIRIFLYIQNYVLQN